MRYRITAPVEGVNATIAGVQLAGSVGETDNDNAVAYFRRHGYEVAELADEPAGDGQADGQGDGDPEEPADEPAQEPQEPATGPAEGAGKGRGRRNG